MHLAAYGGATGGERATLDGLSVRLIARAYSSLALVAHELAINAAKYDARYSPAGSVRAAWKILANGDCELTWEERGGPPISTPARSGFGSTLIGRVVPFDLGGEAEISFPPEGATARFVIPARFVVAGEPVDAVRARVSAESDGKRANLSGMRVLLVEDQVLIALDAESCLKAMGAAQVMIAPTSEHAMKQINRAKPDLAVLDVNLGDHTSTPVAEALRNLAVPFVFATGYGDTVMAPESMKSAPIVRKPYADTTLAEAIAGLLRARGRK